MEYGDGRLVTAAEAHAGMTLRQHYVGQAANGLMTSYHNRSNKFEAEEDARRAGMSVEDWIARKAVAQADALIRIELETRELQNQTKQV